MRREAVAETWLQRARGWTLPNCDGAHSFQPRRPARASAREEGGEAQLRERARGALPSATVRGEGCRAAGARRAARAASASAARQEASNSTVPMRRGCEAKCRQVSSARCRPSFLFPAGPWTLNRILTCIQRWTNAGSFSPALVGAPSIRLFGRPSGRLEGNETKGVNAVRGHAGGRAGAGTGRGRRPRLPARGGRQISRRGVRTRSCVRARAQRSLFDTS